jgi:hypothetical protein
LEGSENIENTNPQAEGLFVIAGLPLFISAQYQNLPVA